MIGSLSGTVKEKRGNWVIIEVAGVGYKIYSIPSILSSLKKGTKAELFTYLYKKEDVLDLYGFSTIETLEFFELLLSVSGIGPKAALNILSVASLDQIKSAIAEGKPDLLKSVSGIGGKTAQRVVVELKSKLGGTSEFVDMEGGDEVYQALMGLGYTAAEAREAMKSVPSDVKDTSERIKVALKSIRK